MLTTDQLTTLKAGIAAQTDPAFVAMRNAGSTGAMAEWLNQPNGTQKAWDTQASWTDIQNAIEYAKYTPLNADIPTTTAGTNKMLAILIKLTVQQNMLIGMQYGLDAGKAGVVAGLLDSVIQVPAGASSALVAPGGAAGVNVANAITRIASIAESLFITSSPTFGTVTAALLSWSGMLGNDDVVNALRA